MILRTSYGCVAQSLNRGKEFQTDRKLVVIQALTVNNAGPPACRLGELQVHFDDSLLSVRDFTLRSSRPVRSLGNALRRSSDKERQRLPSSLVC